jgi:hypothetical protein
MACCNCCKQDNNKEDNNNNNNNNMTTPLQSLIYECRICLEKDKLKNLIRPCLCSGTSKYVHRKCLDEWRSTSIRNNAFTNCSECNFEYFIDKHENEVVEHCNHCCGTKEKHICCYPERYRRYQFRFLVARDSLGAFAIVQLIICIFAWIVYGLDSLNNYELKKQIFPPSWQDDIKLCYYICGFTLFFAFVGLFGSCYTLCAEDDHVHYRSSSSTGNCCNNCFIGDCNCNSSSSSSGSDDAAALLIILVIIVIAFAAIGLIYGFIIATLLIQKIVAKHMQILNKRVLTKSYVVRDLSNLSDEQVRLLNGYSTITRNKYNYDDDNNNNNNNNGNGLLGASSNLKPKTYENMNRDSTTKGKLLDNNNDDGNGIDNDDIEKQKLENKLKLSKNNEKINNEIVVEHNGDEVEDLSPINTVSIDVERPIYDKQELEDLGIL